jgi:hypothetical protein
VIGLFEDALRILANILIFFMPSGVTGCYGLYFICENNPRLISETGYGVTELFSP